MFTALHTRANRKFELKPTVRLDYYISFLLTLRIMKIYFHDTNVDLRGCDKRFSHETLTDPFYRYVSREIISSEKVETKKFYLLYTHCIASF